MRNGVSVNQEVSKRDDAPTAVPRGISRRTMVKGAAWSVPVIAAASAAPFAAASDLCAVAVTSPSLTACGTAPLQVVLKDKQGTQIAGQVSVTLPAGLVWGDGTTGTKVVTVDAAGQTGETVKGTGQGGSFTITAQGLAPCATDATQTIVAIAPAGGRIYWNRPGEPVVNADPNGTVPDPVWVTMSHGGQGIYVLTATGEWWWRTNASNTVAQPDWRKIDAPPIASLVNSNITAGYAYAITTTGDVYSHTSSGGGVWVASQIPGATGVTQLLQSRYRLFAIGGDGTLYSAPTNGGVPSFTPVMTKATPSVPLTNVTALPNANSRPDVDIAVIADGKLYRVDTNSKAEPFADPGSVKSFAVTGQYLFVVDDDGALWRGTTASATSMVKLTGLPPLESVEGIFDNRAVVKALDGSLYNVYISGTAYVDMTPTDFSLGNVVEWDTATSASSGNVVVRLANGDIWQYYPSTGPWKKISTPSPVQQVGAQGAGQGQVAYLLSGNVACS